MTDEPRQRPTAAKVVVALDRMLTPSSPTRWVALASLLTLAVSGIGLWAFSRGALAEFSLARRARVVVVPIRNDTGDVDLTRAAEGTTTDLLEQALRAFPKGNRHP